MNKKEIYEFIELQTRIKYKKRREFAEELGMSQNNLSNVFKKLEKGENIYLNTFLNMIDILGFEVEFKEKNK